MEFNTETDERYFRDQYDKKYYKIIKARDEDSYIADVKVRSCKLEYDSHDIIPKDNFINKEIIERKIYKLVPIGNIKKYRHLAVSKDDLIDKYVVELVK